MLKITLLTILQCLFLSGGQVCFKFAVQKIGKFTLSWAYIADILTNWWLLASGVNLILATILWAYILKHFEFSVAYPITAIAYIFGVLAAIFVFHETVPLTRWLGVGSIILGVMLIAK
ncbi:MAG: EamA family transporter [Dysgonamonadaceae bacterium]|jgi:undecaprenyl phosphate-alpha-L-ara4N flippase subunit ArnE|nr:EamA family transporter [Dysgonamonadaceae bacterium]